MKQALEELKRRIPLLDYLQRNQWTPRRAGPRQEYVGWCPFHRETHPSFYVNAHKDLFYCHGCGRGGDLFRFVQWSQGLSFRQSVAFLQQPLPPAGPAGLLEAAAAFYQLQLGRCPEAARYLQGRGICDPALRAELGLGYAPGGCLRAHLAAQGYAFPEMRASGLLNLQGRDAFSRRIVFPLRRQGRIVNLYGRSLDAAFPHRLLPAPKGDLFAWESVRHGSTVLLVEGLFDLAALWQAGFRNTTCALGSELTSAQFAQLADTPGRAVFLVFDQDQNQAGQHAARRLAQRLKSAGLAAHVVHLPAGHDPAGYFAAGASAADFAARLQQAQRL